MKPFLSRPLNPALVCGLPGRRRGGVRRRYVVCTELFYGTCSMYLRVLSSCNGKSPRSMDSILKISKILLLTWHLRMGTLLISCDLLSSLSFHHLLLLISAAACRFYGIRSSYFFPAYFIPGCCLLDVVGSLPSAL